MQKMVGRERELGILEAALEKAMKGNGSTILVSGEAGVGKTTLVKEFLSKATPTVSAVMSGNASAEAVQPFHIFSRAFGEVAKKPIFEDHEYRTFTEIFVINRAGMLLAQASPGDGGLDADIFAGMFSAVQDFVRDSFDRGSGQKGALGRLEYGDMKILVEHGQQIFLVAVFKGTEHQDMRSQVKNALREIESGYGDVLEAWSGKTRELSGVLGVVESLARVRFLVRKNLEGVSLDQERTTMADRILDMLVDMSKAGTILILLEDVHWADESSMFLLNYLARNIQTYPILILGTMRPGEGINVVECLSKALEERSVSELLLNRLDAATTIALIDDHYPGHRFPENFMNDLIRQCDGNPFFITELMRQLESAGSIFQKDGTFLIEEKEIALPGSIEDLVQKRLDALDPESLALMEFASCMGPEFDADFALSVFAGTDASLSFNGLVSAGILSRMAGRMAFMHAIMHNVAYAGISPRWKAIHHRNIGLHLESAHAGNLSAVAYDLATHFSRSSEQSKAAMYCIMAAEKAEGSYALELAKDFYERGLVALGDKGDTTERRKHILEQLGGVCAVIGEYDAAIGHLDKVLPMASSSIERARVLGKYGYIYNRKSSIDQSIQKLDEAFAALGDESGQDYGRFCITQGNNWWYKGEVEKAIDYTDQAIAIFEREIPDEKELADALRVKALILSGTGKHDRAIEVYSRSLAIYTKQNDERRVAAMLGNIGNVYAEKGEYAKSLDYYEGGMVLFRKLRHKHNIAVMSINMGATYFMLAEMGKAMAYFTEARDAFTKIGDTYGMATSHLNIGLMHYQLGEFEGALTSLNKSLSISERSDSKLTMANALDALGTVFCEQGEYNRSQECYVRSLAITKAINNPTMIISELTNLADLNSEMGAHDEAVRIATEGLQMASKQDLTRESAFAERALARALSLKGEISTASELFAKAKASFESTGESNEVAIVDYYVASLKAATGDTGNAKTLLEGALRTFERLGMRMWAVKVKALMDKLT